VGGSDTITGDDRVPSKDLGSSEQAIIFTSCSDVFYLKNEN